MAKEKVKKEEESCGECAPLWIISFADMISLLMAFFVLLTTFASFSPEEEKDLKTAIDATLAPYGGIFEGGLFGIWGNDDMSVGPNTAARAGRGSENPTLEQPGGHLNATSFLDFRDDKVFTAESKNIFWASGTSISTKGREFLSTLADYTIRMDARIVISESGATNDDLGLQRAIAVTRFLIDLGVPEDSINVAAGVLHHIGGSGLRKLQITVLEDGIYK